MKFIAAIDNNFSITVNGLPPGGLTTWESDARNDGRAAWYPGDPGELQSALHHGNNDIVVKIQDYGYIDYFSMIITTGDCYPFYGPLY